MADQTLKEIALELLEKYKKSERAVIYEYGSDIEGELFDLEAEYQEYKNAIETAAGKTVPLSDYKSMEQTVYKLACAVCEKEKRTYGAGCLLGYIKLSEDFNHRSVVV